MLEDMTLYVDQPADEALVDLLTDEELFKLTYLADSLLGEYGADVSIRDVLYGVISMVYDFILAEDVALNA